MGIVMKKYIEVIVMAVFGIAIFLAGISYSLKQMESKVEAWDCKYQEIDEKVSAFIKVSDPKTIRLYVKELHSILDNMTRLGKIVESGASLDEAMIEYEKEHMKLQKKVSNVLAKLNEHKSWLDTQETVIDEIIEESGGIIIRVAAVDNSIKSQERKLITILSNSKGAEEDLQEIQNTLEILRNSKLSKYFSKELK
tara:strand:- start:640 stop:1227 length:588 start_codon:yes stop_codon:yes gene_type:complete